MCSPSHAGGGQGRQDLTGVGGIVVLDKHVCNSCLLAEADEAFAPQMPRATERWSQGQKKAFSAKRENGTNSQTATFI